MIGSLSGRVGRPAGVSVREVCGVHRVDRRRFWNGADSMMPAIRAEARPSAASSRSTIASTACDVVVLQAAPERVGQQLLGQAAVEVAAVLGRPGSASAPGRPVNDSPVISFPAASIGWPRSLSRQRPSALKFSRARPERVHPGVAGAAQGSLRCSVQRLPQGRRSGPRRPCRPLPARDVRRRRRRRACPGCCRG